MKKVKYYMWDLMHSASREIAWLRHESLSGTNQERRRQYLGRYPEELRVTFF